MTRNKPITLTADTFDDQVLEADRPVLVDFYADWCPPCRVLAPTIDELAGEYAGRAIVAKVNVDEAPELAQRYGISSIPTVLIFRDGEVAKKFVGLASKGEFSEALDESAAAVGG